MCFKRRFYLRYAVKIEIKAVMVIPDTTVETAIPDERMLVSSPIFSARIIGRLPTGTAPIRHIARIAVRSNPRAFMINTIAMGIMIIRSTIYIHMRKFLREPTKSDLAIMTPRSAIDRKIVAFPMYSTVFETRGGSLRSNQKTTRLIMAMTVPILKILSSGCFFLPASVFPFPRIISP